MALTQPRQSKEEDINAVLGRFKAWNTGLDAQREPESKPFSGLEEISYEEALGDQGKRRILARAAPTRQVDLSSAMNAARDTVSLSAASQLQSMQSRNSSVPGPSSPVAEKPCDNLSASPVAAMIATAADITHTGNGTGRHTEARISKQVTLPTPKKAAAVRASSAIPTKVNKKVLATQSRSMPEKRAAQPKAPKSSKNFSDALNTRLASPSRTQPTFKAVLEDRIAADLKQSKTRAPAKPFTRVTGGTTKSSMVPWVESQAVSLKLRISAGEHAAIRAGANEAGLPLAAYMRQCTLDVEVLRKLLKQTIADIRTFEPSSGQQLLASPAQDAVPAKPTRPGLLKRLKNAWLDRDPEAGT